MTEQGISVGNASCMEIQALITSLGCEWLQQDWAGEGTAGGGASRARQGWVRAFNPWVSKTHPKVLGIATFHLLSTKSVMNRRLERLEFL